MPAKGGNSEHMSGFGGSNAQLTPIHASFGAARARALDPALAKERHHALGPHALAGTCQNIRSWKLASLQTLLKV